jgi:hypothetical protein
MCPLNTTIFSILAANTPLLKRIKISDDTILPACMIVYEGMMMNATHISYMKECGYG